jgi:hypothetical protein
MKRIILDENLPQPLRHEFCNHDAVTVGFMGWSGTQNGDLIKLIDGEFDILVTGDQNLRYQQNFKDRRISIIELPYTRLDQLLPLIDQIKDAIEESSVGSYIQIKQA